MRFWKVLLMEMRVCEIDEFCGFGGVLKLSYVMW